MILSDMSMKLNKFASLIFNFKNNTEEDRCELGFIRLLLLIPDEENYSTNKKGQTVL